MAKTKFPRPDMVASGESSTPFTGADVTTGYQPYGSFRGVGQELDYGMSGKTGTSSGNGPVCCPIEGGMDPHYGPIGIAILEARKGK